MAIDVTDYNTRLAAAREDYFQKSQEMKTNFDKNVRDLESTHKFQENAQRDNYMRQTLSNEAHSTKWHTDTTNKNQEDTLLLQKQFNKQQAELKANHEADSRAKQKDFINRMDNINETYRDSTLRTERSNKDRHNNTVEGFETRLRNTRLNNQNVLTEAEARVSKIAVQDNFQTRQERSALVKKNNKKLTEMAEGNNRSRSKDLSKNAENVANIQRNHKHAIKGQKNNFDSTVKNLKQNQQTKLDGISQSASDRINEMERRQTASNFQVQIDHKKAMKIRDRRNQQILNAEKRRVDQVVNNGVSS